MSLISVIQDNGLLVAQRMEWVKRLDNEIFEIRSKFSSNIQRAKIIKQEFEEEFHVNH